MLEWKKVHGVTAGNYTALCKVFHGANEKARQHAVDRNIALHINPRQHPQQWKAWKKYWHRKNVLQYYSVWVEKRIGEGVTIPAPWPTDFDGDYVTDGRELVDTSETKEQQHHRIMATFANDNIDVPNPFRSTLVKLARQMAQGDPDKLDRLMNMIDKRTPQG